MRSCCRYKRYKGRRCTTVFPYYAVSLLYYAPKNDKEVQKSCPYSCLLVVHTTTTEYGGGEWPHLTSYNRGELLDNGNYHEPEGISRRHGICGDPEQVRTAASRSTV